MKKTILAIMLALALVVIPAGSALAADVSKEVTVTASPAILSFDVTPTAWPIDGTNLIIRDTPYYSKPDGGDDTVVPTNPVNATECRFTFTNTGDVTIDITVKMADFMKTGTPPTAITYMANDGFGYTVNGVDEFGASGYIEDPGPWPPAPEVIFTEAGNLFINDLPATGADTVKWGIALLTQTNSFLVDEDIQSIVTCTAAEVGP